MFWIVIRVESLILGHVNAKLLRNVIRACAFWKCALKPCMHEAILDLQKVQEIIRKHHQNFLQLFGMTDCNAILLNGKLWIVIRVESLILGHVNAKLFRNVIRACAFWKCVLQPCMGQSAWTAQ